MRNYFTLLGLSLVCPNFASQDSSQKKGSPPGSPANIWSACYFWLSHHPTYLIASMFLERKNVWNVCLWWMLKSHLQGQPSFHSHFVFHPVVEIVLDNIFIYVHISWIFTYMWRSNLDKISIYENPKEAFDGEKSFASWCCHRCWLPGQGEAWCCSTSLESDQLTVFAMAYFL